MKITLTGRLSKFTGVLAVFTIGWALGHFFFIHIEPKLNATLLMSVAAFSGVMGVALGLYRNTRWAVSNSCYLSPRRRRDAKANLEGIERNIRIRGRITFVASLVSFVLGVLNQSSVLKIYLPLSVPLAYGALVVALVNVLLLKGAAAWLQKTEEELEELEVDDQKRRQTAENLRAIKENLEDEEK